MIPVNEIKAPALPIGVVLTKWRRETTGNAIIIVPVIVGSNFFKRSWILKPVILGAKIKKGVDINSELITTLQAAPGSCSQRIIG